MDLSTEGVTNETAYVPITVTNRTVTPREYTLNMALDRSGSVTKNPNQATYPYGIVVQLSVNPKVGCSLAPRVETLLAIQIPQPSP